MAKELFDQPLIVSPNLPEDDLHVSFGKPGVAGGFNMLWSYFKQVLQGAVDWIDFTPQSPAPAQIEGRQFYDVATKSITTFNDIVGSSLQNGRELWKRLLNDTGLTINNGEVVYISGESGGIETAGLAQANLQAKSISTIAVATNTYINGAEGEYTRIGIIRDINTLAYVSGTIMWLSATVAGGITSVRPSSPNWAVRIGTIGIQSATVGTLDVDISISNNTGDVIKIFNGSILEDHVIDVDSDGAIVTLSLEKNGGGDLSLFFDGGFTDFDATPAATIALTPGTDILPVRNWVYIPKSTGVLAVNTSGFPTGEQIVPVGDIVVQSAASVQTYGASKVQAWTDHLSNAVGQGHITHVNSWIRKQPATHESGTLGAFSIVTQGGAKDDVFFANTVGLVLQLHEHTFPVRDLAISDSIWVYNDFTTKNNRIINLNLLTLTSLGVALHSSNNTYYSIVVFGVVSEAQADCKLYALAPSGSYSSVVDAVSDPLGFTNKIIPDEFIGAGFLISRGVFRYQTTSSGTISLEFTEDLRKAAVGGGGGSSSQTSEFTDAIFKILNAADPTKIMQFDAVNITTGTTRALTIPDKDGTIALLSDISGTGNATISKNNTFAPALIFDVDSKYYNSYSQSGALVISLDSNTNGQGSYIYATIVTDGSPISFPATWKPVKNEYTNNSANYGLVVYFDGVYYQYFLYNIPNSPVIDLTFSLDFNNTKNYPSFALQPSMALNNGSVGTPYSWSVWVRNTSTAAVNMLIHRGNGSSPSPTSEMSLFYNIAGEIICNLYTDNANYISATATEAVTSSWSNIVVVYDGGSSPSGIHIYKDGVLLTTVNTLTGTFTFPVSRAVGAIGNYSSGSVWGVTGQVSSAIELNKALTPSEIVELWNSGELFDYSTASFIDDILTWWKFDGNLTDEIGLINGVDVGTVLYSTNIPPLQS